MSGRSVRGSTLLFLRLGIRTSESAPRRQSWATAPGLYRILLQWDNCSNVVNTYRPSPGGTFPRPLSPPQTFFSRPPQFISLPHKIPLSSTPDDHAASFRTPRRHGV